MHYLLASPNPIPGVIPPLEWVMRHVVIDIPERGSHWFLKSERRGRRHNHRGQPLAVYRPVATAATGFRNRGEYSVTRLLLEHHRGPFPPRTRFANVCGLPQCANPGHWSPEVPTYPWRIEVVANGWQAVSNETWEAAEERVVVRAIAPDRIVHVVPIETWAKRPVEALPTALCGYVFDPRRMPLADVLVTCTGGC